MQPLRRVAFDRYRFVRFARASLTVAGLSVGIASSIGTISANASATKSPLHRVIQVVAAENFWGSIASQLGGSHVQVQSIITNPNTDPHVYEPTPADGRAIAQAQLVIENGIGYDPWAPKLLAADPGKRSVIDVGNLLGLKKGDNPHRWYNPSDVQSVIKAIVAAYIKADPADRATFVASAHTFNAVSLKGYDQLIATIRSKYAGTPVGASESIFSMLAPALGLKLITPYSFLRAISEGTEVTAADKSTIDNQIKHHLIKIYVYNSQNATPDIAAQLAECKAAHIPTATITETLAPSSATYQAWQSSQLQGILAALQKASGK